MVLVWYELRQYHSSFSGSVIIELLKKVSIFFRNHMFEMPKLKEIITLDTQKIGVGSIFCGA